MAYIAQRGDKWLAEINIVIPNSINRCRKSKIFATKLEAEQWAAHSTNEIKQNNSKVMTLTPKCSLYDFMNYYLVYYTSQHKGKRHEITRINNFKKLSFAHKQIHNVLTVDLQNWLNSLAERMKPGSVLRVANIMSAILTKAVKHDLIAKNPMRNVVRPSKPKPRERRISQHEIDLILTSLDYTEATKPNCNNHELAIVFLLALTTAMRQGEIWGLKWDDINFKQRYLTLHDTKNGSRRHVPLSKRAIELLLKLRHRDIDSNKVIVHSQTVAQCKFRKICLENDIKDLRFHDTRHEAITNIAQKLAILDLARMIGHKDINSLMIYYNPTPTEIAQRLDSS